MRKWCSRIPLHVTLGRNYPTAGYNFSLKMISLKYIKNGCVVLRKKTKILKYVNVDLLCTLMYFVCSFQIINVTFHIYVHLWYINKFYVAACHIQYHFLLVQFQATSKLLINYPQEQRDQILDYLFKVST